ncbi:unnamed protein product [Paramecium octaurelia]|uniref:Uncharacterized protein n=1 Tax=Paramecium octaurelia TaxID=43137 RepID=A0A8S1UCP5_PAROT|nr:unnamed protein product [Paramecium octaurelia]
MNRQGINLGIFQTTRRKGGDEQEIIIKGQHQFNKLIIHYQEQSSNKKCEAEVKSKEKKYSKKKELQMSRRDIGG